MAEKTTIASLTQLSKGNGKQMFATDKASVFLRATPDGRLEIVQSLDLNYVTLVALSETPKIKGKPIFLSAKGSPVSYFHTVPADWPVIEDRGKRFPITLTATVGASALTAMQASVGEEIVAPEGAVIVAPATSATAPTAKPAK